MERVAERSRLARTSSEGEAGLPAARLATLEQVRRHVRAGRMRPLAILGHQYEGDPTKPAAGAGGHPFVHDAWHVIRDDGPGRDPPVPLSRRGGTPASVSIATCTSASPRRRSGPVADLRLCVTGVFHHEVNSAPSVSSGGNRTSTSGDRSQLGQSADLELHHVEQQVLRDLRPTRVKGTSTPRPVDRRRRRLHGRPAGVGHSGGRLDDRVSRRGLPHRRARRLRPVLHRRGVGTAAPGAPSPSGAFSIWAV